VWVVCLGCRSKHLCVRCVCERERQREFVRDYVCVCVSESVQRVRAGCRTNDTDELVDFPGTP